MSVPTRYFDGGPLRQKQVLVGGHCSIPPEGIFVNGVRTTCAPIRRTINIDPSCLNCAFRMQTNAGTWVSDFDRDVGKMDLTPVEMHEARIAAHNEDRPTSHTITDARKRLLAHPQGMFRWYRGISVERITRPGKVAVPLTDARVVSVDGTETADEDFVTQYRFRLAGSPYLVVVDIDDPGNNMRSTLSTILHAGGSMSPEAKAFVAWRTTLAPTVHQHIRVHELPNTDDVAVEIMLPHQRAFGFPNEITKRSPELPPPPGATIVPNPNTRARKKFVASDLLPLPARHPERIVASCPMCHVGLGRACHFHAMAPHTYDLTLDVAFADPLGFAEPMVADTISARRCVLRRDGDTVRVVGEVDQVAPHVTIFATQMRHLLEQCRNNAERAQVRDQYRHAVATCEWSWARQVDVGYGAPQPLEPYKSYCAMHLRREHEYPRADGVWVHHIEDGLRGRDFRAEFGDEFGVRYVATGNTGGRLFYDEDFGPGGHTYRSWFIHYPDRSWAEHQDREEFLRAEVQERQFSATQVQLEALTNLELLEDQRGTPTPAPERLPNLGLFVDSHPSRTVRLDLFGEPTDALPSTDERVSYRDFLSTKMTIEHNDTVVEVTQMRARYGIDYVQGSRGQTDPAIIFDATEMPDEPMDPDYETMAKYICSRHPDHQFDVDEISLGDFLCPICDGILTWHESGHEDLPARPARNIRGRVGIGHAVAQDSPMYQEQSRLLTLLCPNWTLKGSNAVFPLTLRSLGQ